jgi:hypothetical protein
MSVGKEDSGVTVWIEAKDLSTPTMTLAQHPQPPKPMMKPPQTPVDVQQSETPPVTTETASVQQVAATAAAERTPAGVVPAATSQEFEDMAKAEAPASDVDAVMDLVNKRPVRHGMWFTAHESLLAEIEHEEVCDIHTEFLKHHPNGGEQTAGFVSVRLNEQQIKKHTDVLRISSYRWAGFKGLGPKGDQYVLPGNYLWFLDYAREHRLRIWMEC